MMMININNKKMIIKYKTYIEHFALQSDGTKN